MKRLGKGWEEFVKAVLPADAPAIQLQEMRRAFYGGAETMFSTLLSAVSGVEEPTGADLQVMSDLAEEINAFAKDMLEGRA